MSREQFWFFYPLRVRYSEVDWQGVVFNANYLMGASKNDAFSM